MADITFEDLIEAVQKLTPEQKLLLKRELDTPNSESPLLEPTRETVLAEFTRRRASGAFDNVESLADKYAKPDSDDLSTEELLKQIHEAATEWEQELDEFFGDDFEAVYVVDTHALIWYLTNNKKLGRNVRQVFAAAERGEAQLVVSAIAIAEIYYANKKNGWFANFKEIYQKLVDKPYFLFVDFTMNHVLDFDQDATVPEMHDRIIAGLARRLNAPLLTVDPLIKAEGTLRIVWD